MTKKIIIESKITRQYMNEVEINSPRSYDDHANANIVCVIITVSKVLCKQWNDRRLLLEVENFTLEHTKNHLATEYLLWRVRIRREGITNVTISAQDDW